MGLVQLTAAAYARMQRLLLPPGRLWRLDAAGVLPSALLAASDELARVGGRAADLLAESDPRQADELLADYELMLAIDEAAAGAAAWTSKVNVTATGSDLQNTGGAGGAWDAGAVTTRTLSGAGYFEFTTLEDNKDKAAGLSNGNPGTTRDEIDFCWYMTNGAELFIYEGGVEKYEHVAGHASGDVLRCEVDDDGAVTYRVNGALVYTSATAATFPLLADSAFYDTDGLISDAKILGTSKAERRARVVALLVRRQRYRPADFQTALADVLNQATADVVIIENDRADAIAVADDREIYRFFVYRDPTDPGSYDVVAAQAIVDAMKPAHTVGHVIETTSMICDDPYSICDRDLLGV